MVSECPYFGDWNSPSKYCFGDHPNPLINCWMGETILYKARKVETPFWFVKENAKFKTRILELAIEWSLIHQIVLELAFEFSDYFIPILSFLNTKAILSHMKSFLHNSLQSTAIFFPSFPSPVPCSQSNHPKLPKLTKNFSWCKSCILALPLKKSYPLCESAPYFYPSSSLFSLKEKDMRAYLCTVAVSTNSKAKNAQLVKICVLKICGGSATGTIFATRCSTGCAYCAASATGAVKRWCCLWILAYRERVCRRRCE